MKYSKSNDNLLKREYTKNHTRVEHYPSNYPSRQYIRDDSSFFEK